MAATDGHRRPRSRVPRQEERSDEHVAFAITADAYLDASRCRVFILSGPVAVGSDLAPRHIWSLILRGSTAEVLSPFTTTDLARKIVSRTRLRRRSALGDVSV